MRIRKPSPDTLLDILAFGGLGLLTGLILGLCYMIGVFYPIGR